MTTTVYGNKYDATKGLSTTEIAKLVRKDIKALIASGELPKGIKTSVRTAYFAGGSSLDVEVTELPAGTPVWNPEYLVAESRDEHYCRGIKHHSVKLASILAALEKVVASYNYDGSDTMTDYFHVRFYGHVTVNWHLTDERKAGELAAALAAEKEAVELARLERDRAARDAEKIAAVATLCRALTALVKECEAFDNFEPDLSGLTRTTRYLPTPGHYPSNVHGYAESLTIATFKANGLDHIARRFWRADVPNTGKIELYLVEPGTEHEDFFRYVDEFSPSKVDLAAIAGIKASDPSYLAPACYDFVARVNNLELV